MTLRRAFLIWAHLQRVDGAANQGKTSKQDLSDFINTSLVYDGLSRVVQGAGIARRGHAAEQSYQRRNGLAWSPLYISRSALGVFFG